MYVAYVNRDRSAFPMYSDGNWVALTDDKTVAGIGATPEYAVAELAVNLELELERVKEQLRSR